MYTSILHSSNVTLSAHQGDSRSHKRLHFMCPLGIPYPALYIKPPSWV